MMAVVMVGMGTVSYANVVNNGDFETGDFTGWTVLSEGAVINSASPIAGSYDAGMIVGSFNRLQQGFGKIFTDSVTASFEFTMADPGGAGNRGLNFLVFDQADVTGNRWNMRIVDADDDGDGDVQIYSGGSWAGVVGLESLVDFSAVNSLRVTFNSYADTALDYDLTVNGTTVTGLSGAQNAGFSGVGAIQFEGSSSSVGYHVDNVSVIPEPATLGLFAFFGGATLFIRRLVM